MNNFTIVLALAIACAGVVTANKLQRNCGKHCNQLEDEPEPMSHPPPNHRRFNCFRYSAGQLSDFELLEELKARGLHAGGPGGRVNFDEDFVRGGPKGPGLNPPRFDGPNEHGLNPPRFDGHNEHGLNPPRFDGPNEHGLNSPRFDGPNDHGLNPTRFDGPNEHGLNSRFEGPNDKGSNPRPEVPSDVLNPPKVASSGSFRKPAHSKRPTGSKQHNKLGGSLTVGSSELEGGVDGFNSQLAGIGSSTHQSAHGAAQGSKNSLAANKQKFEIGENDDSNTQTDGNNKKSDFTSDKLTVKDLTTSGSTTN